MGDEIATSTLLVSNDALPKSGVEAVFLPAHGFHDEVVCEGFTLFDVVAELYREGQVQHIVINGSEGDDTWRGGVYYLNELLRRGLPKDRILCTSQPTGDWCTEYEEFLAISQEKNWKSVALVTQAYMMLRSFLTLLQMMSRRQEWIRAYALTPRQTDWHMLVRNREGDYRDRVRHFQKELEKIRALREEKILKGKKGKKTSTIRAALTITDSELQGYYENREKKL
jgi:hypothetical protein